MKIGKTVLNATGAIIAYSLPGTTEFLNATVGQLSIATGKERIEDFDWIFSPFDSSIDKRILIKISSTATSRKFSCCPFDELKGLETSKQTYAENFEEMHSLICSGEVRKLVLSRTKHIEAEIGDIYPLYISIKNAHPSAFTYLVHFPTIGTWIGASPEKLLAVTKDGNYLTKAIAGTLPLENGMPIWTQKEKDEHQIIESYLKNALSDKGINYNIALAQTMQAGKMAHISSEVSIFNDGSTSLKELLNLLHPNPALSGMPKSIAVKQIRRIEDERRAYYCGFLGPLKGEAGLCLFANIRCAQIFKNGLKLHLGGGITADSVLEKEWEETELKAGTIINPVMEMIQSKVETKA